MPSNPHALLLRRRVAMPAATGLAPPGSPGHRHNAGGSPGLASR
jgi:hypothetical protein